jgi:hypothetical protein
LDLLAAAATLVNSSVSAPATEGLSTPFTLIPSSYYHTLSSRILVEDSNSPTTIFDLHVSSSP